MIIIFTGNGKGKTTAAIGQAIRAIGQDKRVLMIQFIKKEGVSGEQKFIKKLKSPKFKIIATGKGFVSMPGDKISFPAHKKSAQNGLKLAKRAIKSKKWDLIILDEINVAVDLKLIKAVDVLKILKPIEIDIIFTGRHTPKSFIKKADLVTEMKEIKHPFKKGIKAVKGIEY